MAVDDNSVLIGQKPSMNYVLAVVTHFNSGAKDVRIKARGRSISKAVDVAEIVKNRFLTNVGLGDIRIGTSKMESDDGEGGINVSWIEIDLVRKAV